MLDKTSLRETPWKRGEKITKPGMYSGIDIETYHGQDICDGPSVSSSGLRQIFNESPAHFFAHWRGNTDRVEEKEARHYILGRAVHHLLLGQRGFRELFTVQPEDYENEKTGEVKPWNNNADVCRRWHDEQRKKNLAVLLPRELEQMQGMALVLGRHPIVKAGALNGKIERSIVFKDKETGVWVKVRPDAVPTDGADHVDYKTTTSVLWPDLVRTIGECGYHQQGALVRRAAREVLGHANTTFTLVFQEKTEPYCVRVVTLKDSDLNRGERQNRIALDTFARCLKSGHWPGPGGDREDAEHIELSDREQQRIDDQITIMGN